MLQTKPVRGWSRYTMQTYIKTAINMVTVEHALILGLGMREWEAAAAAKTLEEPHLRRLQAWFNLCGEPSDFPQSVIDALAKGGAR